MEKSASIITTFADEGPGLTPNPEVAEMVAAAEAMVAPLVNQVIADAATDISRAQNAAGESPLGNLIADAQRAAMETDFAFMNPGGIRADLFAGPVTYGELFTVQPFGNSLVTMELSGQQIYDLLNQQWVNQPFPRMLQLSGLTYTWDNNRPLGDRIAEAASKRAMRLSDRTDSSLRGILANLCKPDALSCRPCGRPTGNGCASAPLNCNHPVTRAG